MLTRAQARAAAALTAQGGSAAVPMQEACGEAADVPMQEAAAASDSMQEAGAASDSLAPTPMRPQRSQAASQPLPPS